MTITTGLYAGILGLLSIPIAFEAGRTLDMLVASVWAIVRY